MRHVPRKRFGQHFLIDEAVIADIVAAIAPRPRDRMVEIGPGLGALTQPLAGAVEPLHVVEIDRDIVARLRATFPARRVIVHEGDALRFDFSALGPQLRVVGNLPYNISTPLLFQLARHAAAITDIHVMLQYHFHMEPVLAVPAGAFHPVPRVESAVVRMAPFAPLPHSARDVQAFGKVVAAAFAGRRKTLRNALRASFTATDLMRLGVDPGLRAQDLTVEDFVRLADDLAARQ